MLRRGSRLEWNWAETRRWGWGDEVEVLYSTSRKAADVIKARRVSGWRLQVLSWIWGLCLMRESLFLTPSTLILYLELELVFG